MELPKNGWFIKFIRENPMTMDDEQGYRYFRKPPYSDSNCYLIVQDYVHYEHGSMIISKTEYGGKGPQTMAVCGLASSS